MPNAVITGATQGIGRSIAEKLLKEGFSIAVCSRTQKDLDEAKKHWEEAYPTAKIVTAAVDMGNKEHVFAFAEKVLAAFPSIDILVNNAGTFFPGALADEPEGHLERLMEVNLYSAYHLTRRLLPVMKEHKGGHIFNMSSTAGIEPYDNGGAYSITKYALTGFSENLRKELIAQGIKVTTICPGAVYTRSWSDSGVKPERIMQSSDIADMVWAAYKLSAQANVESIVLKPLQGDL